MWGLFLMEAILNPKLTPLSSAGTFLNEPTRRPLPFYRLHLSSSEIGAEIHNLPDGVVAMETVMRCRCRDTIYS